MSINPDKYYYGKLCLRHPELGGFRYKGNRCCTKCRKETAWYRRQLPINKARRAMRARQRNAEIKEKVIGRYGGACVKCDETDIDMLCIDHIEGGGTKHRISLSPSDKPVSSRQFYNWLVKNRYPEGFRVLCHNHNIKEYLTNLREGYLV